MMGRLSGCVTSSHLAALDKAFMVLLFVGVGSQLETLNQLYLLALAQESLCSLRVSESPAKSSGTKSLLSLLPLPLLVRALKHFLHVSHVKGLSCPQGQCGDIRTL